MIKLLDIIYEGAYDAQGVSDKAYEKFHIPTDEPNLKALRALQRMESEPVARVRGVDIYKNPKDLRRFAGAVRALGDIKGNLYVAQMDGKFIHWDMADVLYLDIHEDNNVIRLMRLSQSNTFVNLSDCDDRDQCMKIINAMRRRNPQYTYNPRF